MSYSDFTLQDIKTKFSINVEEQVSLFSEVNS